MGRNFLFANTKKPFRTLKLLMVVFRTNIQWFEVNTSQGMLQPNNPNTRIYHRADGRHAMLNDDLKTNDMKIIHKKSKKKTTT